MFLSTLKELLRLLIHFFILSFCATAGECNVLSNIHLLCGTYLNHQRLFLRTKPFPKYVISHLPHRNKPRGNYTVSPFMNLFCTLTEAILAVDKIEQQCFQMLQQPFIIRNKDSAGFAKTLIITTTKMQNIDCYIQQPLYQTI